jgi:polyhydroxyalkanoate synthesis regulator phasin
MTQARTATTTESFVDQAKKFGDELWKAGTCMFHAGVGVAVATEERARETFDRMVDKGKDYESDEDRLFSRATNEAKELGREVEQRVERVVTATLNRVGVPSRDEITQLGERVEMLTRKVDELTVKKPVVKETK